MYLLPRIQPKHLRHDVVDHLRRAILDGSLAPGQRLKEVEVAERMGVSRGPVREAILALEQEGLLIVVPRKGAYVAGFDGNDIVEIVDLRRLLEVHAIRLAADRVQAEDLSRLDSLIEEMREAWRAHDVGKVIDKDIEFHRHIVALAGNRRLLRFWSQLAGQIRLFLTLCVEASIDAGEMVELHPRTVEALRRHDVDAATDAILANNWEASQAIDRMLTELRSQADERPSPVSDAEPVAST